MRQLERLARLMDTRFGIPGTRFRFGWDGILSIVPGAGDLVAAAPALYLVYRARRLGMPLPVMARLVGNVLIDLVLGSVPVLGTVFDVFFKANVRNLRTMREYLESRVVEDRIRVPEN